MKNKLRVLKFKKRLVKYLLIFFIGLIFISFHSDIYLKDTISVSQSDAYFAITEAFEKVQEASREAIDVSDYVTRLNLALEAFNEGDYDSAYNIAVTVLEEVTQNLNNIRWGKIFPYIIIPVNVVLIAAIIVFFGRNVMGWFRNLNDELFMDFEIVYENNNKKSDLEEV